jgi:hypothetical protein
MRNAEIAVLIVILLVLLGFLAHAAFRYETIDIDRGKLVERDRLTGETRICWENESDEGDDIECGRWK